MVFLTLMATFAYEGLFAAPFFPRLFLGELEADIFEGKLGWFGIDGLSTALPITGFDFKKPCCAPWFALILYFFPPIPPLPLSFFFGFFPALGEPLVTPPTFWGFTMFDC